MSYCRWGWEGSDVYIYASGAEDDPYLVCCGHGSFVTYGDLMRHIDADRKAGLHVPACVDERIAAEIEQGELWVPVGRVPTDRVPDPGVSRPEPEEFTRLREKMRTIGNG